MNVYLVRLASAYDLAEGTVYAVGAEDVCSAAKAAVRHYFTTPKGAGATESSIEVTRVSLTTRLGAAVIA
jgi:hypothetical protein